MQDVTPCPNCQGRTLYASREMSSWTGQHGPDYLGGLGSFLRAARFTVVVCRDCGHMRYFASPKATAKLKESKKWRAVTPSDRGGL
jgi:predicted nucleic-acid-binding Zn-ribbon protein